MFSKAPTPLCVKQDVWFISIKQYSIHQYLLDIQVSVFYFTFLSLCDCN